MNSGNHCDSVEKKLFQRTVFVNLISLSVKWVQGIFNSRDFPTKELVATHWSLTKNQFQFGQIKNILKPNHFLVVENKTLVA